MNLKSIQNIIKFILVITVFWVLLFGLFQMDMSMNTMNGQANCPFASHSMSICQMNPLEHISEWQSMFTMLPVQNLLSFLFALFALFVISKFTHWNKLLKLNFHLHQNNRVLYAQVFNPLKEAYSKGILNPKLF
jgi:flagellar biosynthesis protein FlhB